MAARQGINVGFRVFRGPWRGGIVALTHAEVLAVIVALLVAGSSVACAGDDANSGAALQLERTTDGNTTVVRNLAGSHWSAPATLQEELSIGVLDGDDASMFGNVVSVWATDDRIYVIDEQAPALRVFDQQGRHLHDLGRAGQGPGEYEYPRTVLALPDGTVVLQDGRSRITYYGADGAVLNTWTIEDRSISNLTLLHDGTLVARRSDPPAEVQTSRFFRKLKYGVAEIQPGGKLGEPRYPPDFGYEPPSITAETDSGAVGLGPASLFAPSTPWTVSPDGSIVAGLSDRYRFEIHSRDGQVTIVERYWDPLPVPPEHSGYLIAQAEGWVREFLIPDWSYDGDPPFTAKPAYDNLVVDRDGRIWVVRLGASESFTDCVENPRLDPDGADERPCWRNRHIIDAFTPEGEYLGELQRPDGLTFSAVFIKGEHYYAAVEDEDGLVMVKRFRLVTEQPGVEG